MLITFMLFFLLFYSCLQWWILTLRHDPMDLPFIDSSSPSSAATDSVQTRKLLQMIDQGSTELLKC